MKTIYSAIGTIKACSGCQTYSLITVKKVLALESVLVHDREGGLWCRKCIRVGNLSKKAA